MRSCIFEGQVNHSRLTPARHDFKYRLFMMYLDLAELEEVFLGRWFWSVKGPALARFRREDHLGDPSQSLENCVRGLVEERLGRRPTGPVRLLTQLSYFGYGFSPVCFYYCFDSAGEYVESIVTEVNNTPWGEQYCYVLSTNSDSAEGGLKHFKLGKQFHVSPFMDMAVDYDWKFSEPSDHLLVHMESRKDSDKFFEATLRMTRSEITGRSLARLLTVYPLITVRIVIGIYWQALRLFLKRCPIYDHPRNDKLIAAK